MICSSTTNGRNNRDLDANVYAAGQPAGVSYILIANKNVDMLPNFALFCCDAVTKSRADFPQCGKRLSQRRGRSTNLDTTAPPREFPQRPRNVEPYWHSHLVFRRDLLAAEDLVRDGPDDDGASLGAEGRGPEETSSIIAVRTQTMEGSPSTILCHVFPSSSEPKSCPLRVPK